MSIEAIKTIQAKFEKELRRLQNVRSVGIGLKRIQGKKTKVLAIVVGVTRKLPLKFLAAKDVVPKELEGIQTDVVQIGEQQYLGNTARVRPIQGGYSIGNVKITAGTMGCVVYKADMKYILSNAHVLTPDPTKVPPAEELSIVQPGVADGGDWKTDLVGQLTDYIVVNPLELLSECPVSQGYAKIGTMISKLFSRASRIYAMAEQFEPNLVDAAIAIPYEEVNPSIYLIGIPAGIAEADLDREVVKSGRTTGRTFGVVEQVNVTVNVGYGTLQYATFSDQVIITGKTEDPFSKAGDSGSIVVTRYSYEELTPLVCGLLFAGNDTENITIANRIQNVEELLGIRVRAED